MERTFYKWDEANLCDTCAAELQTLATHSTTDAKQLADGWEETPARRGCAIHKVAPNVILLDGRVLPFAVWAAANG